MKMSMPPSPTAFGTTAPTSVSSTNNTNSESSTPTPSNSHNSTSVNHTSSSGEGNQQFCLRWNNFRSNLQQTFLNLFEKQSFVDVTISCDEKSIQAHRMVLSACSPYFQTILKESDCSHPVIILQGVKWCELKAVVDFMYKGEINVSQDELAGLLRVAESLKVRGLTEVCDGDEPEATTISTSPAPRPRVGEEAPRKRRRYSGDDTHINHARSRSPSPDIASPPMAMDFLDTTLDPIFSQANFNRSSASSQNSSHGNGNHHGANVNSPASLASSLSSLAAHLPGGMPPPGHSLAHLPPHLAHLPPLSPLSPLLNMHHPAMARPHQTPEDFEIRPGIAEMIREEERRRRELPDMAKLLESSHHWMGTSMADSYQAQVQAAWQKSWNQTQSLLQNLRFRERGPLKSWRPETMADAIHAVLKEGLSLSQAARKYDIPYPTFVLYANRVHNLLGPSAEPGDLRPKGRGRPQRILLGSWPEEQIKVVIRAVVFRDTSVFKDEERKARMENKHKPVIKQEQRPASNPEGSITTTSPDGTSLAYKPGTPNSTGTPDTTRSSSSTPGTSLGGPSIAVTLPHALGQMTRTATPQGPAGMPSMGADAPFQDPSTETHPSSMQHSPQQSPAVSTPLPPLSSPGTPEVAVSVPSSSPPQVSRSPIVGGIAVKNEGMQEPNTSISPSRQSPISTSPPRHSPSSFKSTHTHSNNGPTINGNSPNTNGPMISQSQMPFPPHMLQQQIMGSMLQGSMPPNMPPPPPPNHARPNMPPTAFPGYMRMPMPPHAPRSMQHEESPEALLFNKIVGGSQFPPMNLRPYFHPDAAVAHGSRNPNAMFHRDPSLDSIKSEPEPILN
ncbi:protein bric-a-brac 1 isoform X2 [Hyalella azteca]|uniref:Protein bric-a-brac 1 isoform X2 n=1 Tax=Hyalella azteca TaxID=294128 RepID=A0A8B7PJY6_HYAAZ|nr:protein bric-a-brac 1 isoform X2 [Hyalella azteca]